MAAFQDGRRPGLPPLAVFFLLSALCFLICLNSEAATYYVATNGNDGNSGTSTPSPFLTLQRGVDAARAGDTIIVRAGTYGSNGVGSGNFPVFINSAGSSGAPITLKSETKWGAKLDCGLNCHSYINLQSGAAYWVIQDFEVTNTYWAGIWANNASGPTNITIKGNHFHHIGNRDECQGIGIEGIYASVGVNTMIIDGNRFHDIGRNPNANCGGSPPSPNHDHGIYSEANNLTIINNVFYNNVMGWGVQAASYANGGAQNWLIANNTFAFPNPGRDGQIVLWADTTPITNITIRNNIFYQPQNYALSIGGDGSSITGSVQNNLIYGAGGVWDNSYGSASVTVGANTIGPNPMLVNPSGFDFHLQSGSPAKDTGMTLSQVPTDFDGNIRPQGAAYDIGAFELGGTPPPPGCLPGSASWQGQAFASQTGTFQASWDSTPNSTSVNGVTGLSAGPAADYTDMAAIALFTSTGTIQARDGGGYHAQTDIFYSANTAYHFRLVVNIPAHTYNAYVTPAGGSELAVGLNYAFRTEQAAVTSLAYWNLYTAVGTHSVCNFQIAAAPTSPCDVNHDNATNVVDVQQEVNQALNVTICTADINLDGRCNVIDVQRVVNAALGGNCVSP